MFLMRIKVLLLDGRDGFLSSNEPFWMVRQWHVKCQWRICRDLGAGPELDGTNLEGSEARDLEGARRL